MVEWNYLDLVFGGLIIVGALRGLVKGFIVEIASLLALILGVYGAIRFSGFMAEWLVNYVSWKASYIDLAAFGLTFTLIIIAVSMLGKFFTKLAKIIMLNWLNRVLGLVFGALKMAVVSGVLLIIVARANAIFGFIPLSVISESLLSDQLLNLGEWIFDYVPQGQAQLNDILQEA